MDTSLTTDDVIREVASSSLNGSTVDSKESDVRVSSKIRTKEERLEFEKQISRSNRVPKSGHVFKGGKIKTAGNYILGPILGTLPVHSMVQCLARKKNTDEFYTIKILTVRDEDKETQDDMQGKMLLHTEHSLLSFLHGQPGVMQQHGLFQDYACDAIQHPETKALIGNGKIVRRMCLVLDCVVYHDFDPQSVYFINLQHYVIGCRNLKEIDALSIFFDIVTIVNNLHKLNVVHRDLKLANLVLNRRSRKIIFTNFCLGQHLMSDKDKLQDQRGSPAYISPDVLTGRPYMGKPSDMWALGVVLYTMLFGKFPFYHKYHQELFKMIKAAKYTIPSNDGNVKSDTIELIKGLLMLDPLKRLTASQVLLKLGSIINSRNTPDLFTLQDAQVVPDGDEAEAKKKQIKSGKFNGKVSDDEIYNVDFLIKQKPKESGDESLSSIFASTNTKFRSTSSYSYIRSSSYDDTTTSPKANHSISIVEGDIRTFSQNDLFTHRSLFPSFSPTEMFGNWRPNSGNPPSSTAPKTNTRFAATTTTTPPPPPTRSTTSSQTTSSTTTNGTQTTSRIPARALPPPVPARLNSASSHATQPSLYDFSPLRRWTLAVMHRVTANSNGNSSTVPEGTEIVSSSSSGNGNSVHSILNRSELHSFLNSRASSRFDISDGISSSNALDQLSSSCESTLLTGVNLIQSSDASSPLSETSDRSLSLNESDIQAPFIGPLNLDENIPPLLNNDEDSQLETPPVDHSTPVVNTVDLMPVASGSRTDAALDPFPQDLSIKHANKMENDAAINNTKTNPSSSSGSKGNDINSSCARINYVFKKVCGSGKGELSKNRNSSISTFQKSLDLSISSRSSVDNGRNNATSDSTTSNNLNMLLSQPGCSTGTPGELPRSTAQSCRKRPRDDAVDSVADLSFRFNIRRRLGTVTNTSTEYEVTDADTEGNNESVEMSSSVMSPIESSSHLSVADGRILGGEIVADIDADEIPYDADDDDDDDDDMPS